MFSSRFSNFALRLFLALFGLTVFLWLGLFFSPPVKAAKSQLALDPDIQARFGRINSIFIMPIGSSIKWYGDEGAGKFLFRVSGTEKVGFVSAEVVFLPGTGWQVTEKRM